MNTLHFAIKCNLKPLSIVIGPSTPSPVLIRRYVNFVEVWLEAAADKGALLTSQLPLLRFILRSESVLFVKLLVIIWRAADKALVGSIEVIVIFDIDPIRIIVFTFPNSWLLVVNVDYDFQFIPSGHDVQATEIVCFYSWSKVEDTAPLHLILQQVIYKAFTDVLLIYRN